MAVNDAPLWSAAQVSSSVATYGSRRRRPAGPGRQRPPRTGVRPKRPVHQLPLEITCDRPMQLCPVVSVEQVRADLPVGVDVAAVAEGDDENEELVVVDRVDDAVVADPDP